MSAAPAFPDPGFWRGRRVLLTGQTGFKGAWLALWLSKLGAEVTGLGLAPEGADSLHDIAGVATVCDSRICDLRDREGVAAIVREARPSIALHLAAQALVRRSMRDPVGTIETNVGGTASLLDALSRHAPDLEAAVVVTSDKVYRNDGAGRAFVEDDPLGGKDPYSASKAACEIIAGSFADSMFAPRGVRAGTARGGNVIGGGDFAEDRLGPDCVRAALAGEQVVLRQPKATRPWQHALDCLNGYLLFAERLARDPRAPATLNFGPEAAHDLPVLDFAQAMMAALGAPDGVRIEEEANSVEAPKLAINAALARRELGWRDSLVGLDAIQATADWYQAWRGGADMAAHTLGEIDRFQGGSA